MKLRPVTADDGVERVRFDCPGCESPHVLPVTGARAWGFNGDHAAPTFTPSILITYTGEDEGCPVREVCHSFVTLGRIQFLGDCTHALAGLTVDLPEVP